MAEPKISTTATHQHTLVKYVMNTTGPVLELGAGFYSTRILHEICSAQDRQLLTLEGHPEFAKKFTALNTGKHKVVHVPDWEKFDWSAVYDIDWSVIFVDHAPGERRNTDIIALKDKTEYMLVHDSEAGCYGYEPHFKQFKHREDDKTYPVWTTILSNKKNLLS
jgi:hypothetical protein